ncbi:SRPBCC family protein [Archangium lansingense]|uniref:SRPBCC family protein n=1 Tax=Archangium lansingense TaxID=2995310 RepID=A0ABT4A9X4_9BACT|nr:SRPBCC family protein [Archangium lansinium]MCY1078141.1 SRPBCC family protein [Archangium lansinium]
MSVSVCPTVVAQAPASFVWALLVQPRAMDRWWDAESLEAPDRPLVPGDRIIAHPKGAPGFLRITADVTLVDTENLQFGLDIRLPLGLRNEEVIRITPLGPERCRITFG